HLRGTWAGFLFLAVVLDAFSRRIIGRAMTTHLKTSLVLDALEMAYIQRRPIDAIHHSDHGCQYTALAFAQRCTEMGVRPRVAPWATPTITRWRKASSPRSECELLDRRRLRTRPGPSSVLRFIEGS